MKKHVSLFAALLLFLLATGEAEAARNGARWGLELSLQLLIPSLLPLFAVSSLMNRLGLGDVLAGKLGGFMGRLFGVSGAGASAFILGLCGGYPLGAATTAELYASGRISREEGERLLSFCDNTGPAFAVAALGMGAFQSVGTGLFLYAVHLLSAVLTGLLVRGRPCESAGSDKTEPLPFPAAMTAAVNAAGKAVLGVCTWVIVFSALLFALNARGTLDTLAGILATKLGWELRFCRALIWSLFELSGTVGLMPALAFSPLKLALAAFALSWGGLCVHFQSLSVCGTLSARRRLPGKLLHGLLAASMAYIMSTAFLLFRP
ncbi:MAG: sporulation protein [Ruminococcaceae bacterium]|nr:sporulation protein [Oscillospiraceae bacterium]